MKQTNKKDDFSYEKWQSICQFELEEASKRCPLNHEVCIHFFSLAIEKRIDKVPKNHRLNALEIAKNWDYQSCEKISKYTGKE
jgi:tRNA U34 5-carboxymethylaminomethyl modifying enzyme MnmG/GidA